MSGRELEKSPFSYSVIFKCPFLALGNKANGFENESCCCRGSWSALQGIGGRLTCLWWPNNLCSPKGVFWSINLYGSISPNWCTTFGPIGFGFSTGEDATDLLPEINESFFCFSKQETNQPLKRTQTLSPKRSDEATSALFNRRIVVDNIHAHLSIIDTQSPLWDHVPSKSAASPIYSKTATLSYLETAIHILQSCSINCPICGTSDAPTYPN